MEEYLKKESLNEDFDIVEQESDINVYPVADLPIPYGIDEKEYEIIFLDPTIGEGKRLVNDKSTPIPHLFALLRQFITPVCQNIGVITEQMLKRGVSPNDVDATTGMAILHYAVRATALCESRGLAAVKKLLSSGADPRQRCLYSGMNALHIAAYFDVPSVVRLLLKSCDLWPSTDINSLCEGFNFGTSLHIACSNLSAKAVEVLLQKGSWTHIKDDMGQTAMDCLPTDCSTESDRRQAEVIKNTFLQYKENNHCTKQFPKQTSGLTIGSKVVCKLQKSLEFGDSRRTTKTGILRFVGPLSGSSEQWAGVELFFPEGQNSGDYKGEVYFRCKKNHGIFVSTPLVSPVSDSSSRKWTSPKAIEQKPESRSKLKRCKFKVGDRVLVAGKMEGVVRYVGETQFASGTWCGIELDDEGPGRNNGSVSGVSYFKCDPTKGIFSPPSKLTLLQSADVLQNQAKQVCPSSPDTTPRDDDPSQQESTTMSESNHMTSDSNHVTTDSSDLSLSLSSPRVQATLVELAMSDSVVIATSPDSSFTRTSVQVWDSSTTIMKSRISPSSKLHLHVGMRVAVRGTGRKATVKFIGETDFSNGIWVGLDLGSPCGKNGGSVQNRRYFTCPPKHGLMLRPHRVSYNGVNGNEMLPPHLKDISLT